MPDDILVCPSCNRKLRMADTQQGQIVQCPLCSVIFRTPIRSPPPAATEPAAAGEKTPPGEMIVPAPPVKPAPAEPLPGEPVLAGADAGSPGIDVQRALLLPGMTLLICGVLSG